MPGRVEEREIATRRVCEDVHPVEAEVLAERLHVGDLSVHAVGRRIGGYGGIPRTPQIEHDQPAPARQTAEIAGVGGGSHRASGQDEQRLTLALEVVGEFGSVVSGEGGHGAVLMTGRRNRQSVYAGPSVPLRRAAVRRSRGG